MKRAVVLAQVTALALVLSWAGTALACPVCLGTTGPQRTVAQDIADSGTAVLATPTGEPRRFRIITALKGQARPGDVIQVAVVDMPRVPLPDGMPILLGRHPLLQRWTPYAAVPAGHDDWLRRMVTQKRLHELGPADWAERALQFLPDLFSDAPLIRDTAIRELSRAPYEALRGLRPVLSARRLIPLFNGPDLSGHQPIIILLLGIEGSDEADRLLAGVLAAHTEAPRTDLLPALMTALIERRGEKALPEIRAVARPESSSMAAQALVAALGVHGSAKPSGTDGLSRARVVALYGELLDSHPELAGAIARDLEQWREYGLNARLAALAARDDMPEGARLIVMSVLGNASR